MPSHEPSQVRHRAFHGRHVKVRTLPVAGPVLLGAGLVADFVGLVVMLNAVPHLYDAVNAYNDGLAPP